MSKKIYRETIDETIIAFVPSIKSDSTSLEVFHGLNLENLTDISDKTDGNKNIGTNIKIQYDTSSVPSIPSIPKKKIREEKNLININFENINSGNVYDYFKNDSDGLSFKHEYKITKTFDKKPDKVLKSSNSLNNLKKLEETKKPKPISDYSSTTYLYEDGYSPKTNNNTTYIRHIENENGLTLPGSLVKASSSFLPVNRSLHVGSIFNGSSFGILCRIFR